MRTLRRVLLALGAAVLASAAVAAAAVPRDTASPVEIVMPDTIEGSVDLTVLEIPLRAPVGRKPRVGISMALDGRPPAGSDTGVLWGATRVGDVAYVAIEQIDVTSGAQPQYRFGSGVVDYRFRPPTPATPQRFNYDVVLFDPYTSKPLVDRTGASCDGCVTELESPRVRMHRFRTILDQHVPPRALCDSSERWGDYLSSHRLPGAVSSAISLDLGPRAAVDVLCNRPTRRARALRRFVRPPGDRFSVDVTLGWAHGQGESNVCLLARTTPPQSNARLTALFAGEGMRSTIGPLTLGPDGQGLAAQRISRWGDYSASWEIVSGGRTMTGQADISVTSLPGPFSWCQAP